MHEAGMNWTGLAAQVWDAAGGDEASWDYAFYRKLVQAGNGPALDVGCGTGRLMLRYLAEGLDVDGIDTSPDMLAQARAKAEARGLKASLYQGAMQTLDLPRRYQAIYIPCGTFCLIIDREQAWEALRRFYDHLLPGGTLAFNLYWVFSPGEPLSDSPTADGPDWKPLYNTDLPDGRQMRQHMRLLKLDRAEQVFMAERRYQLWRGESLLNEQIFPSNERWYFKYEMTLMLEKVGFRDVQVKGNYTDEAFKDGDSTMVFVARRPI
jgi:SAM-dependent methyltransferase